MAGLHNELQRFVSLQDAYRAALGEKTERFTGLERAGETLTPVVNLWERPEWAFLRGEGLYMGTANQVAGVAQFSACGIFNPANSRRLVVVEEMTPVNINSQLVVADGGSAIVFTTAGVVRRRDLRLTGSGSFVAPGAVIGSILLGAAQTNFGWIMDGATPGSAIAASRNFCPLILPPGTSYFVSCVTANLSMNTSFKWRERLLLPGELG